MFQHPFRLIVAAIPVAAAAVLPSFAALGPQAAAAVRPEPRVAADGQPPGTPHLFRVAGLGGCEIDMRISLSADESDPPSVVLYRVTSNGTVIATVHADTRGSAPGFGTLDVFASRTGGTQALAVSGVDSDGNVSGASNTVTRSFGSGC